MLFGFPITSLRFKSQNLLNVPDMSLPTCRSSHVQRNSFKSTTLQRLVNNELLLCTEHSYFLLTNKSFTRKLKAKYFAIFDGCLMRQFPTKAIRAGIAQQFVSELLRPCKYCGNLSTTQLFGHLGPHRLIGKHEADVPFM